MNLELGNDGLTDEEREAYAMKYQQAFTRPRRDKTLIPDDVSLTLLRAMVWCGGQITEEQRNIAWKWVEDHTAQREEMGQ